MNPLDSLATIRPAMRPATARPVRGFSLIELMVAIAIVAVVATAGLPEFSRFVRDMRLGAFASDLRADMQFARSESIRRNARVLVCPRSSTTSTTCSNMGAAAWANGWLVCHDTDADGTCDAPAADGSDPNPARVRAGPALPLALNGPAAAVTFFPTGSASSAGAPNPIFTMTGGTSVTRTLSVAPSGNLTSTKTST